MMMIYRQIGRGRGMQLSSRIAERVAAFLGLLISDFRLMSALKK